MFSGYFSVMNVFNNGDLNDTNAPLQVNSSFRPSSMRSQAASGSEAATIMSLVKRSSDGGYIFNSLGDEGYQSSISNNSSPEKASHLLGGKLSNASWSSSHEPMSLSGEDFARKVFVGGLPFDVQRDEVERTFGKFGPVFIDWPRRPEKDMLNINVNSRSTTGYVFVIYQNEKSVKNLLEHCVKDGDKYFLFISSPTMSRKPVQVRPWRLTDMEFFRDGHEIMCPRRTVFIGGVPRPCKAKELAKAVESLYGAVSYVGIDIDPELRYPKGAARVTFVSIDSLISALTGRYVHVTHGDVKKRVELKPYVMEEQPCDECYGRNCGGKYAPYFCGDPVCLQYYCEKCWELQHFSHNGKGHRAGHQPLIRCGDATRQVPFPSHAVKQKSHKRSSGFY